MLILKRRPGESIFTGKNIKIIVLDNTKNTTRIGIETPTKIPIVREELQQRGSPYEHK